MLQLIQQTYDRLLRGRQIDRQTALQLALCPDQQALASVANELRRHFMGERFHLCSIINARSGNCTENCRFCAQSARYQTGISTYEFIDADEAMTIARDSETHGVDRLSLVTSGHSVNRETLEQLGHMYAAIQRETTMDSCASMGFLDLERAYQLTALGISRYHCNLEANQNRFSEICTSHSWQDKVATLEIARSAGMSLCSGGIIGMGETMEDRVDLALELRALKVKSIPINILTPIPGTPLADLAPLPLQDVLATIALFRFINPDAVIRMAGGRQQLGTEQYRCFTAGANGAIVGNFLTTTGSSIADDLQALQTLGFTFKRSGSQ
jgi:biotin synthase